MKKTLFWLLIFFTFIEFAWAEEEVSFPENEMHGNHVFDEKRPCNQGFIEINWSVISGTGAYTVDTHRNNINNMGLMVEPFFGVRIPSIENMKIGFAPTFYSLTGSEDFIISEQISPSLPLLSQKWKVDTFSMGTLLMVKYMLGFTIETVDVEIFNGIGFGYFKNHLSWEWADPADPTNTVYSGNNEVYDFLPCVDAGIQMRTQITEYSSLGVNFGVNRLTIEMDNFEMPFVLKYGISYFANY